MGTTDANGNRVDQDHFQTVNKAPRSRCWSRIPLLDAVTGRYFEDN